MHQLIKIACPYCGVQIKFQTEPGQPPKLMTCKGDDGCSGQFVASTETKILVTLHKLDGTPTHFGSN